MASNVPIILSAAVCKLKQHKHERKANSRAQHANDEHDNQPQNRHDTSHRLSMMARHEFELHHPETGASNAPPHWDELLQLVERGADFQQTCADQITLDGHILYYNIYTTPHGNIVYLCLTRAPNAKVDHSEAVQRFLHMLKESVSSDSDLCHAISLPNLHSHAQQPTDEASEIQPRFVEIVMNAHQMMNSNHRSDAPGNSTISQQQVPSSARIVELQRQVDGVRSVMSDNVIRIMERGERLDNLDTRTEALHASSQNFKTTSRRIQRNMCLKNLKWTIVFTVFCALLVSFIVYTVLREMGVFGGNK